MVVAIINRMPRRGLSRTDAGSFTNGLLIMHHLDAGRLLMLQLKLYLAWLILPLSLIGGDVPIDWRYAMLA